MSEDTIAQLYSKIANLEVDLAYMTEKVERLNSKTAVMRHALEFVIDDDINNESYDVVQNALTNTTSFFLAELKASRDAREVLKDFDDYALTEVAKTLKTMGGDLCWAAGEYLERALLIRKAYGENLSTTYQEELEAAREIRENLHCPNITPEYPLACNECPTCKAKEAYDKIRRITSPDEDKNS